MTNTNLQAAPGWYPDPYRQAPLRWWDGAQWTAQVSGAPAHYAPVHNAPAHYAPVRRQLPPDTPVYTPWIWLAVLLPLVSVVLSLAFNPVDAIAQSFRSIDPSNPVPPSSLYTSIYTPGYFISAALGWVFYGLAVVFSWLDYRALQRRGLDRPFHWAWSFLLVHVYTIGRSVIVRRVSGGRGGAPIWVSIAVIVISIAAGIALTAMIMAAVFQSVGNLSGVGA